MTTLSLLKGPQWSVEEEQAGNEEDSVVKVVRRRRRRVSYCPGEHRWVNGSQSWR